MDPPTFSERLATRHRLWWGAPWRGPRRTLGEVAHRLRERRAFRDREDPDEAWRCCPFWPRTLVNKWNGREFAARHGCDLPQLYWRGSDHSSAPLESLPSEFVIRPVFGTRRRGVAVVTQGRELLRGQSASPSELRDRLPRTKLLRPAPILIEEFVMSEDGSYRLPLELKVHTFGDTVAAIEVLERTGVKAEFFRYYTPAWEPFEDRMSRMLCLAEVRDPPQGLERLLALAAKIGVELGTYMRIDFFASEGGCVFNEFSSTPLRGTPSHAVLQSALRRPLGAEVPRRDLIRYPR